MCGSQIVGISKACAAPELMHFTMRGCGREHNFIGLFSCSFQLFCCNFYYLREFLSSQTVGLIWYAMSTRTSIDWICDCKEGYKSVWFVKTENHHFKNKTFLLFGGSLFFFLKASQTMLSGNFSYRTNVSNLMPVLV